MARPKLPKTRTHVITAILTEDEKIRITKAARVAMMPVSSWVRMQLLIHLQGGAKTAQREPELEVA
jgi:hypothetical protein